MINDNLFQSLEKIRETINDNLFYFYNNQINNNFKNLVDSPTFKEFVINNQEIFTDNNIISFVIFSIKIIKKSIILNLDKKIISILDEDAIKFLLCFQSNEELLSYDEMEEIENLFINILKRNQNEFSWVIPLFKNPEIFKSIDTIEFIKANQNIANKVPFYKEGYLEFINCQNSDIDKEIFKNYLKEGIISLSESTIT